MLLTILALQFVLLLAVVALVIRKPPAAETDPRLGELGDKLNRLELYLREALAQIRTDAPEESARTRKENADSAAELRKEVLANITTLGTTLREGLNNFRDDNKTSGDQLRRAIEAQMETLAQRLSSFTAESGTQQTALRESLNAKLTELANSNTALQDRLRTSVEERLTKLNDTNTAKLEEMRATVDEKLHSTLQTRLTESFGQVTDQLTKVHAGLGEMTKLSEDVDDLTRIFTKVRSRGQIGEAMLETLLKQMLAEGQFVRNEQVKPETQEAVEFAVRFPGPNGSVLLPIDSKFPRESWERLESAYDAGGASEIRAARSKFESVIRTEAKRISSKYINEPITTPNAIMFLPTEGLYAEVMRCDGLHDDIQQNYHVMIAGPSNLSAILTSFQMVFSLVNLQKKGGEVWRVLAAARSEFGRFGILMDKMDKQVGTVQSTIRDLGTRTRAINKTLQDVSADPAQAILPLASNEGFDSYLPALAASHEED